MPGGERGGAMDAEPAKLFSGVKVVVVDDNTRLNIATAAILEAAGCKVMTMADGFGAMGSIFDFKPDVLVIDADLPRLDGYQVCSIVRRNPELDRCVIVLISARGGESERLQAQRAGANGLLVRPLVREELLALVAHFVTPAPTDVPTERAVLQAP